MSEYMFGVSKIKPTRKAARQIDKIAKRHDAYLVEAVIPGSGYLRWFCAPNMGSPFDSARSKAVHDELRAAGIYDGESLAERHHAS